MIKFQKYLFKTSIIGLCGGVLCFSPLAKAESFQDALTAALNYHPSVDAVTAARQSLEDKKVEEWSAQFPEINVNATAGRVYGDNATSRGLSVTRGAGYSYLWEGSAAVTQPLFDGFETEERIEAAEDRLRSANLEIYDVRENLALETAQAYFDVMRSKEALDMIKEHNQQINDYHDRIVIMVDEGVSDTAELKLAEDITILLDNIYEDYNAQYLQAQAVYQQLTGDRPSGHMSLPEWDHTYFPATLKDAMGILKAHPALKAAEYSISASEHDVEAEKSTFYPDVDGELSFLKKDLDDIIGGEVTDARAVVKMNWNFSTGGAQYARIRQRQAAKFETEAQRRDLERQLAQTLQQAWVEYESAERIADNMGRRKQINQELFDTNQTQFEGAQIRLLQLMQSENQYFQTRLEYINAKYRQKLSELAVLAALGELQETMGVNAPDVEYVYKSPFRFDDDE